MHGIMKTSTWSAKPSIENQYMFSKKRKKTNFLDVVTDDTKGRKTMNLKKKTFYCFAHKSKS